MVMTWINNAKFNIKAENKSLALSKIIEAQKRNEIEVPIKYASSPATLEEAMEGYRYDLHNDSDSNVTGIGTLGSHAPHDYKLHNIIAPYVEDGSFIEILGEDGARWRWAFHNGKCIELTPIGFWPDARSIYSPTELEELPSQSAILSLLVEDPTQPHLVKLYEPYVERYRYELYWQYPFCDGYYLGGYIATVKEGYLFLPYNEVDVHTAEIFSLQDARILSPADCRLMAETVHEYISRIAPVLNLDSWKNII